MAKKQTRRSVSLNAGEFALASDAAEAAGVSLSRFTELALRELRAGKPNPAKFALREKGGVPQVDELIAKSSVGAGLRNIQVNGIDAELASLDAELAQVSDAQMAAVLGVPAEASRSMDDGPDIEPDDGVRVEYDE